MPPPGDASVEGQRLIAAAIIASAFLREPGYDFDLDRRAKELGVNKVDLLADEVNILLTALDNEVNP